MFLPVLNDFPFLLVYFMTYFVISKEAGSSGKLSRCSLLSGGGIEAPLLGAVQGEALAVLGHPHHQLGPGRALLYPVVYGVVLQE